MNKPLILVVEDDPAVARLISTTLETRNYQYHRVQNGAGALLEAASARPDVILLDLGLPDMDGIDVIRKIRGWSNVPILVVSARSDDTDKVSALDAGADDYLTKPFSVEELLARLRVALRRVRYDTSRAGDQASIYENGELRIDYAAGCVYRGGTEIHLTPIEYKLICVLAKNTGKVLTHNYLLNEVWGSPAASDTPSLRVFMATLRKKIEEDPSHPRYIQTHIGVGYRMIDEDVPCEDILSQLNAAKSALHGCGKVVLEGHIKHCVRDGIEHGDADKTIEQFTKAVERFSNMG